MKLWTTLGTVSGALMLMAVGVRADVLLHQPHDARFWSRSDLGPHSTNIQRGDDFKPTGPVLVESVTFWMTATWAFPPDDWMVTVHRSTDESSFWEFAPEYPWIYERTGPSSITDLGAWNDSSEVNLYEVRFDDLDWYLDPADSVKGTFWFSSFGLITDRAFQDVGWGTAGDGAINGEYAWRRWTPWNWPGWAPHLLPDGSFTDFAMKIEGTYIPAPSAFVPFALLAFRRRRRQRRR